MRICKKCFVEKDEALFDKAKKNKDGLKWICKSCCSENNKLLYETTDRKLKVKLRRNSVENINKRFLYKLRSKCKCLICNEGEVSVLDFHHVNPTEKEYTIGEMKKLNIEKIKSEVRKCVVLCSNCHRKLHAGLFCLIIESSTL